MALADDLDGDGRTDLVVATMNGVVYCFEAAASRFHPLHAWPAQVPWAPGFATRSLRFEPETPLAHSGRVSLSLPLTKKRHFNEEGYRPCTSA